MTHKADNPESVAYSPAYATGRELGLFEPFVLFVVPFFSLSKVCLIDRVAFTFHTAMKLARALEMDFFPELREKKDKSNG